MLTDRIHKGFLDENNNNSIIQKTSKEHCGFCSEPLGFNVPLIVVETAAEDDPFWIYHADCWVL